MFEAMKRWLLAGIMTGCLVAVHTEASEKIIRVRLNGEGLALTVETSVGESYQLQCRTSLVSGEWVDLGADFLAVSTNTVRTVTASETHCFLRVVEAPGNLPNDEPPLPPPPPPPPPE